MILKIDRIVFSSMLPPEVPVTVQHYRRSSAAPCTIQILPMPGIPAALTPKPACSQDVGIRWGA